MDLDELRAFVAVVERGSLAAASKSLRFPIATLRRRLDELEARMGVRLLERDRQGARPTGAGVLLADKARSLLSEMHSLAELVRGADAESNGEVIVAVQQGIPPPIVSTFFRVFTQLSPNVSWSVRLVDDPAAALTGEVQAAVCIADRPPDGPWIAKKIFSTPEHLVASPGYLQRHGTPKTIDDLKDHRVISWTMPGRSGKELPLANGRKIPFAPSLRVNDIWLARQLASQDLALALVPDKPLPLELLLGRESSLVRVLEDQVQAEITFWLLATPATWRLPRLRFALEQLVKVTAHL
jgi:DNA-binding transcriptional LysR family regulator